MRAEFFKRTVFVLCLIAVLFFLGHLSAQRKGAEPVLPPAIKFKVFQGKNPPFNFTFEYPEAWRVKEGGYKGNYDMVAVLGVTNKNAPMIPGMFITKRSVAGGGNPKSLMEGWLKTESRYKNFKVLSSEDADVYGQKALKSEYVYTLSLPLWNSSAQKVMVRKEQVVTVKGEASFEITFMGTDEQFKIYKPIFRHMLETFRFLDQ